MSCFEFSGFCYVPLKNIDFCFVLAEFNLVELKLQNYYLFGAVEILVQFFYP